MVELRTESIGSSLVQDSGQLLANLEIEPSVQPMDTGTDVASTGRVSGKQRCMCKEQVTCTSFYSDEAENLQMAANDSMFHSPPSCRLRSKKRVNYKENDVKRSTGRQEKT